MNLKATTTLLLFVYSFSTCVTVFANESKCRSEGGNSELYRAFQVGETWGKVDLNNNIHFSRSIFRGDGTNTAIAVVGEKVVILTNHHIINSDGFTMASVSSSKAPEYDANLRHSSNDCGVPLFQYTIKNDPEEVCKKSEISIVVKGENNPILKAFQEKRSELWREMSSKYSKQYERYRRFHSAFPGTSHFFKLYKENYAEEMRKARKKGTDEALSGLSENEREDFFRLEDQFDMFAEDMSSFTLPLMCDKVLWDSVSHDVSIVAYKLPPIPSEFLDIVSRETLVAGMIEYIVPKQIDFSYEPKKSTQLLTAGFGVHQFEDSERFFLSGDVSKECILLGNERDFFEYNYVSENHIDTFKYRDFFKKRISVPLGCDVGPGDSGSPLLLAGDSNKVIGVVHSGNTKNNNHSISELIRLSNENFVELRDLKTSYGGLLYKLDVQIRDHIQKLNDPNSTNLLEAVLLQSVTSN